MFFTLNDKMYCVLPFVYLVLPEYTTDNGVKILLFTFCQNH